MKKILLSILSLVSIIEANAQFNLTYITHAPHAGDAYTVIGYDTTASFQLGLGADQSWDFSTITTANTQNNATIAYSDATNNQAAPTGSTIIESKNAITFYYKGSTNMLEILGYTDASSHFSVPENSGITARNWPYAYSNSINDQGNGTYSTSIQNVPSTGNISPQFNSKFAGYGTLKAPDGTIYQNVILVVDSLIYSIDFIPQPGVNAGAGTNQFSYKFYIENEKFPVVNMITTYNTQFAFSGMNVLLWEQQKTTIIEQKSAEMLVGNGINDLVKENVTLYPNPANNYISLKSNNIKTVEIININGTSVKQINGNELNNINIETLSNGMYTVKMIDFNDQPSFTKLIKQ